MPDSQRHSEPHTIPLRTTCEMLAGCPEPIAYIDAGGWVYCQRHGLQRQATERCRKLRPYEVRRLARGEAVTRY